MHGHVGKQPLAVTKKCIISGVRRIWSREVFPKRHYSSVVTVSWFTRMLQILELCTDCAVANEIDDA